MPLHRLLAIGNILCYLHTTQPFRWSPHSAQHMKKLLLVEIKPTLQVKSNFNFWAVEYLTLQKWCHTDDSCYVGFGHWICSEDEALYQSWNDLVVARRNQWSVSGPVLGVHHALRRGISTTCSSVFFRSPHVIAAWMESSPVLPIHDYICQNLWFWSFWSGRSQIHIECTVKQ